MTPERERELRAALRAIVAPAAGGVGPALDTVERVAREEAGALPPRLAHYLANRSYGKALAFLEGREAEHERGRCG